MRSPARLPSGRTCCSATSRPGALDSKTGVLVLEALLRINQELSTTTALITHNAAIREMAHRTFLFGDGRITGVEINTSRKVASRDPLVNIMRMLDRKLFRDLQRMWAQALAIALVLAGGAATFVLASGAYRSLDETRQAYYERYRFGEIFADIKRAPKSVGEQIRAIDGVAAADLRISRFALLDVAGYAEPATGQVISVPERADGQQNKLHLRAGRLPEFDRADEAVINEPFAKANRLRPGDTFKALLNGKQRTLKIVGVALSPEFIYAIGPGDLVPDDRRFAVIWMSERVLAGLFDLEGAFNAVSIRLLRDARADRVIERLDAILARYGGTGAYTRKDQFSHAFLNAELTQLDAMRRVMPPIFLLVSAFLINMILTRVIALEREQVGLLKAIGYGPLPIAMHYVKFVLVIAAIGIAIGFAMGAWLGQGVTRLYAEFFHFPFLIFRNDASTYVIAGAVSATAAVTGAVRAVGQILRLAPAVAMQPPAPPRYNRGLASHIHTRLPLSQMTIMSLRHMARWPMRSAVTALGIALGLALLVTALLSFELGGGHDRRGLLQDRSPARDHRLQRSRAHPRDRRRAAAPRRDAVRALAHSRRTPSEWALRAQALDHRQARQYGPLARSGCQSAPHRAAEPGPCHR